jgi:hypothetical protein
MGILVAFEETKRSGGGAQDVKNARYDESHGDFPRRVQVPLGG